MEGREEELFIHLIFRIYSFPFFFFFFVFVCLINVLCVLQNIIPTLLEKQSVRAREKRNKQERKNKHKKGSGKTT